MKKNTLLLLFNLLFVLCIYGQSNKPTGDQQKDITALIDRYSEAREKSDTILLKDILTTDIDQLVSNGEWQYGLGAAVQGMLKSSGNRPGTRTLRVETIRMLNATTAIADCRYEIQNMDGSTRKMWSSFVVILEKKKWKISAIRNMLPAGD